MIDRYTTEEMRAIWSEESKYASWLLVELYAAEAYAKVNRHITAHDVEMLKKNARVDLARIKVIEQETHHDVVAFTRAVSETLGAERRWLHYGLTSTDVVDTAQSYRLQQANEAILKELIALRKTLASLARKHSKTFMIGRTHGIHAEVTTFGYKMALWYDEIGRNITRFEASARQIEVAKISGVVGNYANVPLSVQDFVARKMGLQSSLISTQTLQRDRHAEYVATISIIASSLDKFATEIRHLQRTEVDEVNEVFASGQKGSSAMPHKKNPIASENISGLSRILRGYVVTALENVALWHERDISHSSAERIMLPDVTTLIHYMTRRFRGVMNGIIVNKERMIKNIWLTNGVIFSQRALLKAIAKNNWSREKAYDIIQLLANQALQGQGNFLDLLVTNNVLNLEDVKEFRNLDYYAVNIPAVLARLGL